MNLDQMTGATGRQRLQRAGRNTGARFGLVILILGSLGVSAVALPSRALAAPATPTWTFTVINGPWALHPGNPTDTPTISSPMSEWMATNTTFAVQCVASGDPITASGTLATDGVGDSAWEYGTDTTTGNSGFVSDQGINTPTTQGNEFSQLAALGIPTCGYTPPTYPGYDGQGAANWALAHAMDVQPNNTGQDEDCTWFAAQAVILGGGLQQTSQFNLTASYGHPHIPGTNIGSGATGTAATWLVPDFVQYVLSTYPDSTWQELDFSQNSQPYVQPGDIIVYSWNGPFNPYDPYHANSSLVLHHLHVGVVVDDATNTFYPEISEWGNLKSGQTHSTYPKTGWTWSAYYGNWIQSVYPNPHVYVLHIVAPGF